MSKIGILHPGEMGVSIAASAVNSGHDVYWVSMGRSVQTRQRAEEYNLIERESLRALCQACDVIVCVCPPHAAEEVATQVIAEGFEGIYLDANAISPQRARMLNQMMQENNIQFIDGSIIGGPAWKPGETFLYLCGKGTEVIRDCFQNGALEIKFIGVEVGRASALKMCYAAYSKGTTALLASILAAAGALGVGEELYQLWDMDDPDFSEQVNHRLIRTTARAWRFAGEMEEIASTFQEAGLPGGFHEAAAEIYHRMAGLKNTSANSVDEILTAIIDRKI
jgi:3-hydroxyisobutyrate dehydrogenase-like beta-hydroxyacid dehydrogenase